MTIKQLQEKIEALEKRILLLEKKLKNILYLEKNTAGKAGCDGSKID